MTCNRIFATGSYAGDGSGQSINVGFQPVLVFTFANATGGPGAGKAFCSKISGMPGDDYYAMWDVGGGLQTADGITLTSTGFDLGSDDRYNKSGNSYYWFAIREGPWAQVVGWSGVPTGPLVVPTGRKTDLAFVVIAEELAPAGELMVISWEGLQGANYGYVSSSGPGGHSFRGPDWLAQMDLDSVDSIEVRASSLYSEDATHTSVLLPRADGTQYVEWGSYVGTGGGDVTIDVGYQPVFAIVFSPREQADRVAFKTVDMPGDDSYRYTGVDDSQFDVASGVTITSTGLTLASPNWDSSGAAYYWIVFRDHCLG